MKATITIQEEDFKAFKMLCLLKGYKISTRIQHLIKKDVKDSQLFIEAS
jgi:hypothetical protein